jgi:hypothetical protein
VAFFLKETDKMGFYNLDEIIEAHKSGKLPEKLSSCGANDIAIIKHELAGFAEKKDLIMDYDRLIEDLDFMIDERLATETPNPKECKC